MDETMPKRRDLAKTLKRILEAAFDLFASQGYAKTSLRDIAGGRRGDIADRGCAFHLLTLMNGFMMQAHHRETAPVSPSAIVRLGRSQQVFLGQDKDAAS